MKKLSKRILPIRVQVYAGLMLLCTVILMIYAFTAVHIYYFSGNVASLTDNYYGTSNFLSTCMEADAALKSLVENSDKVDVAQQKTVCVQAQEKLFSQLAALKSNESLSGGQYNTLLRAMDATLSSYKSYTSDFFRLWEHEKHQEAYTLYFNILRKCGTYLQRYSSELLEEELRLGQGVSQNIRRQNTHFLGMYVAVCILAVLVSLFIYKSVSEILRPVYTMIDVSNQLTAGHFDIPDIDYSLSNEMGRLVESFNQMKNATGRLMTAMEEKRHAETLLAEARARKAEQEQQLQEAVVLQLRSQIMPHFLFNTLNIISRTARVEGAPKTEELLYALAHLFRASLQSTVAGQVTLAEEINMTRDYFILQQARFGSRVGLTFRVAKDVYPEELQVPSFFLQPLVENSILHGLENRVDGGRVRVRIQRDGTHLYISICDNGSGMSRERLAEVIREDTVRERRVTGIGVRNVRARILMAHPGNAFTIYSKENLGTIVRITLYLEEE